MDVAFRPSDAPARHIVDKAFQTLHVPVIALVPEQLARADLALRLSLHELMLNSDPPTRALIDAGEAGPMAQAGRLLALTAADARRVRRFRPNARQGTLRP